MLLAGAAAKEGIAGEQLRRCQRGGSLRQPAVGVVAMRLGKARIIIAIQRHPFLQPCRRHREKGIRRKDVFVFIAKICAVMQSACTIGEMILADFAVVIGFAGHQADRAPLPVDAYRMIGVNNLAIGVVRPEQRFIRIQQQAGDGRIRPQSRRIANSQFPYAVLLLGQTKGLVLIIPQDRRCGKPALIKKRDRAGRHSGLKERCHLRGQCFLRKCCARKQRQNQHEQNRPNSSDRFFHKRFPQWISVNHPNEFILRFHPVF